MGSRPQIRLPILVALSAVRKDPSPCRSGKNEHCMPNKLGIALKIALLTGSAITGRNYQLAT
jgi:hypothetical protein